MAKISRSQLKIKVPLPKGKIKEYLEVFKINSLSKVEESQLQALFTKLIDDFMSGRLCLDEFSSISNYLWWEGSVMVQKERVNKEFYNLLQLAGELSFYIRARSKQGRRLTLSVLDSLFDYYKKSSEK